MYYNLKPSEIYCAIVSLSKASYRIITSLVCDKMSKTVLPAQVIALSGFMGKKTLMAIEG